MTLMRVFLTGGTGFVGSHVAERLLEEGHEVVAMVRATSDTEHLDGLGVETVEADLSRVDELDAVLADVGAVIHVAGLTAAPSPEELYRVNADGTRRLVDRVATVGGPETDFVYISSVSARGPSDGRQPPESGMIPEPVSHYGHSKLEGEGAVLAHRDTLGVTILRPPIIYGPRDRDMFEVFQLADRRLAPVMGGPTRWLSIIHGEDVARAAVACLEQADGEGEIYGLDDGGCYSWRDLGDHVSRAVGKSTLTVPIPEWLFATAATVAEFGGGLITETATFNRDKYREMSQPGWVCDCEPICEDLGWEPKWDLADGTRQTARWYRREGWL